MKYITALALAMAMGAFAVNCDKSKPVDDALGKKIIKQWMKARAAASDDCTAQKAETLDATLAKLKVDKKAFGTWKRANKPAFKEYSKKFQGKFCNKNAEEGDDKKKKKKKK